MIQIERAVRQLNIFLFLVASFRFANFPFQDQLSLDDYIVIGVCLGLVMITNIVPWKSINSLYILILPLIMLTTITISACLNGGVIGSGTGPYYMLTIMWMALNFNRLLFSLSLPMAYIGYFIAIIVAHDFSKVDLINSVGACTAFTIAGVFILQLREKLYLECGVEDDLN